MGLRRIGQRTGKRIPRALGRGRLRMGTEYGPVGTLHTRATFTVSESTRATGESRYRILAAAPVDVRVLVPVHALAGGPPPGRGERGRGAVAKFEVRLGGLEWLPALRNDGGMAGQARTRIRTRMRTRNKN